MNISDYIGLTPLVKLKSTNPNEADVYVKIESANIGGSIKSRVAKRMVEDAIDMGLLTRGMTIIEPTGGNTGIGLAIMAIVHDFHFVAVVPDNYSKERISLLQHYNAEVILSDSGLGNDSHIKLSSELQAQHSDWICLDQFNNHSCIEAHYYGTATEILKQITPDAFVASVGSGGTFTGISRHLKEYNKELKSYVVQPDLCDIFKGVSVPHKIQGTSLGIIPPLLDYSLIDGTIEVKFDEVKQELKSLMTSDALYLGLSSGANILAAKRLAHELGSGKCVCTVAPDGGQYYAKEIFS